ncbi:MAG: ATP synthase F1 subunit delta [Planctomycetota bacterium]
MIDPVTSRYTEALFGLAKREGALADVEGDVSRLAEELSAPGVGAFFLDARLSVEARRSKIEPLLSGMHQLTQNFVHLLFDKRRENVLRSLGEAFRQRALRDRGAVEGVVESARPLGAAELGELSTALGGRLGKTVTLRNEIVPDLLGGVRVVVESRMLDNSVRGRLDGLKKRMEEAPLPSTQS